MLKSIRKRLFPFLIAFSALSVSFSAAFYSVGGLSKLFAGATTSVIIMAGSLEVAKLIIASLLYQYWDTINKVLRAYLTLATAVLMLITSMGIYGYLSAAYQTTYQKLKVNENKITHLETKKEFYDKDVARYEEELERIGNNINTLSNAKASQIQVRDTSSSTGLRNTISTTELRLSQDRINVEEENRKEINQKRTVALDSLQKYQLQILDLKNVSEEKGELGPLRYLSDLTGKPMDKIINWLLLVIIFVFDPLAIALVVTANFAFNSLTKNNTMEEKKEVVIGKIKEEEKVKSWDDIKQEKEDNSKIEKEKKKQKMGDNEDIQIIPPIPPKPPTNIVNKINKLKKRVSSPNLSSFRRRRVQNEIDKLESQ